ncbi:MAG: MgtC/SapB family protein [Clostridia bacterium]|nr:MgtC/SapB family protein [Clostridia bacterium]
MHTFLELINDFGPVSSLLRLILAAVLGGLIGSERGRHGRAAGMRTHILICLGAAMTALTGLYIAHIGGTGDISRISAQVISGIGFLGVGTILIRHNSIVMGLTTAAGMWSTAAIGIAVGYGFYLGAIIATAICIFTATGLSKLERRRKNVTHFYAEITADENTDNIVETIRTMEDGDIAVDIVLAKSNTNGRLGLIIDVRDPKSPETFKGKVSEIEGVCLVIEEKI